MRNFWAFDVSVNPPLFCEQSFSIVGDSVEHVVDGQLRAVVHKDHAAEYMDAPSIKQVFSMARDVEDALMVWMAN